ncbi:MAG: NifB/NifX family molybdenum-iron cluster-binding protein [Campylobacterales bacterium]|nr:NifB/NifX family molybdenum-iron cluster-binding protein [Campylobacterales bacterium]
MIAIPIDTQESTTLSELFGKVPYFALLDIQSGSFSVVENEVKGQGPKSAEFLKPHGVEAAIFYHMGEGVYQSFVKNGIDVYSANHQHLSIDEIYRDFQEGKLTKLDESNYQTLLDPGEGQSCQCGCE